MQREGALGFSLIELMVVVAIIAFLSVMAMPSFTKFLAKAKRAEAYMNLNALYTAQKAHWAENNTYTTNLSGPDSVGWKPEGKYYYTYGTAQGSSGKSYFIGALNTPSSALKDGFAQKESFMMIAAGDIDGDGEPDILGIKETGEVVIIKDDLV